ncbi:hypothetical protein EV183_004577 [Coemansia sp. RSA 2336]|nr:hypothetical protein EV183_004577 [Coemansia sp. RSA 2336]
MASAGRNSTDCTQCQQITKVVAAAAATTHSVNDTRELCTHLQAHSWNIGHDSSWALFVTFAREAAFTPDGQSPCLPSQVSIIAASILEASVDLWRQTPQSPLQSARLLAVLQFAIWLSTNPTNSRVLAHHSACLQISKLLNAFHSPCISKRNQQRNVPSQSDIRSYQWRSSPSHAAAVASSAWSKRAPATVDADDIAYGIFCFTAVLCEQLYDADRACARFLQHGIAVAPSNASADKNSSASSILSQCMCVLQKLDLTRLQTQFSPILVALCHVIGSIVVSVDAQQLGTLAIPEQLANILNQLDSEDAYMVWRLLELIRLCSVPWDPKVQAAVDRLWQAVSVRPVEHLQNYVKFNTASSPANCPLFPVESDVDQQYAALCHSRIPVEPSKLNNSLDQVDDPFSETRLRRYFDVVLTQIDHSLRMPIAADLAVKVLVPIHRAFLNYPIGDQCSAGNGQFWFEYARLLWQLWSLDSAIKQAVFGGVNVEIWNRLLSLLNSTGEFSRSMPASKLVQQVAVVAGWLVANVTLPPPVYKLIFSKLAEALLADDRMDIARAAAQGLAVISQTNAQWFRQLLHETQSACFLLAAIWKCRSKDALNCSSDSLSVVSLSEESIADLRWDTQLLGIVVYMLRTAVSTEDVVIQQIANMDHVPGSKLKCMHILHELAADTSFAVSELAIDVATKTLCWLLSCAEASATAGPDAALVWSQYVTKWITDTPSSRCAYFLKRYRECLVDAALAAGAEKIHTLIVESGAIESLLELTQKITLLDLCFDKGFEPPSDNGNNDSESDGSSGNELPGTILGETLKLLALLIHGSSRFTSRFSDANGYGKVHAAIVKHSAGACAADMAQGVLALLSGSTDPENCCCWKSLAIDRNWLRTLAALYSGMPLSECTAVLRFIVLWCENCRQARWWWSQSTIVRQSIERLYQGDCKCAAEYIHYLGRLVASVMSMSTCASDVKLLLRALVSGLGEETAEAAKCTLVMRQTLSQAFVRCAQKESGSSYFVMDHAALHAPYFRHIPEHGFTFSLWIWPELLSFEQQLPVEQRGLSLAAISNAQQSAAISSHLAKDRGMVLNLRTASEDEIGIAYNYSTECIELRIKADGLSISCSDKLVCANRWHSVMLCYAPSKRGWSPFGSSNVRLYIDGAQAYKGAIPYIDCTAYRTCTLGRMQGRLASVRMFDGLLRSGEIELLHHLGPRHTSQLRKQQLLDPSVRWSTLMQLPNAPLSSSLSPSITKDISELFSSGTLSSRLLLSLDANATTETSCLDLSPIGICQTVVRENMRFDEQTPSSSYTSEASNRTRMAEAAQPWQIHGDLLAINTTTIHQLLPCVGGVEAMFMFLLHLDWIYPDPVDECDKSLELFFYFLRNLLRGNPQLLANIKAQIVWISRVIQCLPDLSSQLTMDVLRAIQSFQTALDIQGGNLPSVSAETSLLWGQVHRELVLNFSIWRQASMECQLQYLKEVQRLLCDGQTKQGKRSNAAAGISKQEGKVRWILRVLFDFYPYDTSQHHRTRSLSARPNTPSSTAGTPFSGYETLVLPANKTTGECMLTHAQTKQLRAILLRTLELFLTAAEDGVEAFDISHLVQHLLYACNRDTVHTSELLQMLFRCLADGSTNAGNLASKLLGAGSLDVLAHIIECDDDGMAADALNIVVLLLTMSDASHKQESTASRITNSLRGRVSVVVDEEQVLKLLALVRTKRSLTPALYQSLLVLALRDHAALLASVNIETKPISPYDAADTPASYVTPLPARLIQDVATWLTILELANAPETDPAVRVVVMRDFHVLLKDEPANFERLVTVKSSLLHLLVTVVVLGGFIVDKIDDPSHQLPDAYAKAMGHLELVPHTTLDIHMQNLAVGHIRARKAWVQQRMDQLTLDSADMLLVQAQTELMTRTLEWSQAAQQLIEILAVQPDYADQINRAIVALWALTPTGSLPLAVQLLSQVISRAALQLNESAGHSREWLQNACLLSQHVLDMLFNYRQFQEYVAYHHEQLKLLSTTAGQSGVRATEDVYHSQHSPWDDIPQLARDLSEFMLLLNARGVPMCLQMLRLAVSGIRSMHIQRVDESLHYLLRLLEQHSSQSTVFCCSGNCGIAEQSLAVLGYVHEAFIFAREQNSSVADRWSHQYLDIFQKLRTYAQLDQPPDWKRFIQSIEWQDFYRMQLMPAMRSAEEEEMRLAKRSRFSGILHDLLVRTQKSDAKQVREARNAQTAVASSTQFMGVEESMQISDSDGRWLQSWRQRMQALAGPRGPWQPFAKTDSSQQRWILDMAENNQRMRRRLIKNVNYEDHRVAASRRDRTGQCQAEPTNSDCFPSVPSADLSEEYEIIDFSALSEAASGPDTASFSTFGERIALLGCVYGRIELAQSYLRFVVERDSNGRAKQLSRSAAIDTHSSDDKHPRAVYAELNRDYCWQLSDIQQVHFRRYMMRSSALEIFFRDRTSVLLNFAAKKTLMQLVWKLTSLPAVNCQLALSDIRPPPVLLRRLKLTEHWQRGELSNFDYLMGLNTVAGRSYNDLSQYPVFPWIIRDYTSKWLDLTSSKTFRDLSRPMGALNEKRLKHFIERYESFEDPSGRIKKFHYGTHYSSAASVAYYLVRMEPFASVHVSLQSGKFDHADRQFHSIADTWNSCVTSSGDVKELIPEFYYLPEFLVNHNSLNLGQKQDGTCLGDVQLPPWAATPEEFIHINRQALESEYVSANLHKWIDLIFGYKQRGVEAVKAHNVFYYLTYEGAVNIDAVQDPVERASIESQINYFGQTPTQLFATPHPPRQVRMTSSPYSPLVSPSGKVQQFVLQASHRDIAFVSSGGGVSPTSPLVPWSGTASRHSRVAEPNSGTVVLVDSCGRLSVYDMKVLVGDTGRLQLVMDPKIEGYYIPAAASPPSYRQQLVHASGRPTSYAVVSNAPDMVVSCAHLDKAIRFISLQQAPSSSLSSNMTNAYASAVVSSMSTSGTSNSGKGDSQKRVFGGLFGSSSSSSRSESIHTSLAARLLEFVPPAMYLPDQPTCVSVGGQYMAVGSEQGTVAILSAGATSAPLVDNSAAESSSWLSAATAGQTESSMAASEKAQWTLQHMLCGHDAAVMDVAINADHDMVVSASCDGTAIIWAARSGQYLQTLTSTASPARIERVLISAEALILCYSVSGSNSRDQLDPCRSLSLPYAAKDACPAEEVAALHVYSTNGRHLRTRKLVHELCDIALTQDGRYGACVSRDSRVAVFDAHTLSVVRQFELPACGCSIAWGTPQQLVVGCEGGSIVVISAEIY